MLRNFALFLGLCLAIIAILSWPANGQQDFFGELFSKGSVSVGSDKVLHCQAFHGNNPSIQVAPLDLGSLGGSGGGADPFAGLFGGRRR